MSDLNALGKHLDEEAGQEDSLNRCILDILEKVAQLEGLDETNRDMEEVAIHSNEIRNFFFDSTKHLNEVIPPVLLARMSYKDFEVPPRKVVEFTKSKLAQEDKVAKEQINIRVSSRGQAAAKEAPARPRRPRRRPRRRFLDRTEEVVDDAQGTHGRALTRRAPCRPETG